MGTSGLKYTGNGKKKENSLIKDVLMQRGFKMHSGENIGKTSDSQHMQRNKVNLRKFG